MNPAALRRLTCDFVAINHAAGILASSSAALNRGFATLTRRLAALNLRLCRN